VAPPAIHAEAEKSLNEAAASGQTVTIVTAEGVARTGTLSPHPTVGGAFILRTGRRGRPTTFYADDDVEVIFE
jgi:hypothetical protein